MKSLASGPAITVYCRHAARMRNMGPHCTKPLVSVLAVSSSSARALPSSHVPGHIGGRSGMRSLQRQCGAWCPNQARPNCLPMRRRKRRRRRGGATFKDMGNEVTGSGAAGVKARSVSLFDSTAILTDPWSP